MLYVEGHTADGQTILYIGLCFSVKITGINWFCWWLFANLQESSVDWLYSNKSQTRDKVNSEMLAEIRSESSSPIWIPCTAHQDYFYLEDCSWYHFSKWESASAAWVIHLGSSDNFPRNMCVLFIPEGIPQHMKRDGYLWKGNKPGEQFVIKGILRTYIDKPLCGPGR